MLFALAALASAENEHTKETIRLGPGDQKAGYSHESYATDSLSLEHRSGNPLDLAAHAQKKHLGLPVLSEVQSLEPNSEAIALGRKLFFDRRLSRNKTMSCAMCHIPEQGFSNNELKRPIGFEGRSIKRNAPTLLNVAFNRHLFVDARETELAQQVWSPLLAANEMNNPSVGYVVEQLRSDPDYAERFASVFGEAANMLNIGEALAQYQQALIAGNSRFDKWYYGAQSEALNKLEKAGFDLFRGKAGCSRCHLIHDEHALFTDHDLHNTGVGYQASMLQPSKSISVQLAPGLNAEVAHDVIASVGEEKENDLGRYEVTLIPDDRWKFRTPGLRNVALTAPYMHNGEFLTLSDVIQFYNQGGIAHEALSQRIKPLNLNAQEQKSLRAFLLTLTSEDVPALIADAFSAPVSDTDNN